MSVTINELRSAQMGVSNTSDESKVYDISANVEIVLNNENTKVVRSVQSGIVTKTENEVKIQVGTFYKHNMNLENVNPNFGLNVQNGEDESAVLTEVLKFMEDCNSVPTQAAETLNV